MTKQSVLNSVEEVLEDIRQGKVVIVVDDEDRENEGDFIVAAEKITPEIVNFMLHNGRGVMCAPLTEDRCKELELDMQVTDNTIHKVFRNPLLPLYQPLPAHRSSQYPLSYPMQLPHLYSLLFQMLSRYPLLSYRSVRIRQVFRPPVPL